MQAHEIRQLDDEELSRELDASYRELLNIRFRIATRQLSDTSQIRTVKRKIARLHTIARQRQLGGS